MSGGNCPGVHVRGGGGYVLETCIVFGFLHCNAFKLNRSSKAAMHRE